jgi:predicted ATP-grasp superfamily ATP-dependent carboligase
VGKVLVLGEDTRIVLPIFRSLGRRGIEVHAAWCPDDIPAMRSRYVKARHRLAPYAAKSTAWLEELRSLLERESYDLVIPATEAACYPLHVHRERFESLPGVYLLNRRAFEITFDKSKTCELAQKLGIPVPQSVYLDDLKLLNGQLKSLNPPYVLKPVCSVNERRVTQKHFVRLHREVDRVYAESRRMLASGLPILVQEHVEGIGRGIELLARDGEVLFAFSHERLHETNGYGSTYRRSIPLEERFLDAARRLMRELNYTGVAMVEFRVNDSTGQWALLEINARFWGSLPLALACGADFPRYLYEMLVEQRREFPAYYRHGVRCRNLLNDLRWMWRSLHGKAESRDPSSEGWEINPISRLRWLAHLARLVTFRDRSDTFAWHDPAPAAAEAADLLKIVLGKGRATDPNVLGAPAKSTF